MKKLKHKEKKILLGLWMLFMFIALMIQTYVFINVASLGVPYNVLYNLGYLTFFPSVSFIILSYLVLTRVYKT